jgi:hypothetical protein
MREQVIATMTAPATMQMESSTPSTPVLEVDTGSEILDDEDLEAGTRDMQEAIQVRSLLSNRIGTHL